MDERDAIAIPATIVFLVLGFYGVVMLRLRDIRRRARAAGPWTPPSRWQLLSRRQKTLRRLGGVVLGIVLAAVLQVVVRGLIAGF